MIVNTLVVCIPEPKSHQLFREWRHIAFKSTLFLGKCSWEWGALYFFLLSLPLPPQAAGYTLAELVHLTRSAVLQQRVLALQALGHIIQRVTSLPSPTAPSLCSLTSHLALLTRCSHTTHIHVHAHTQHTYMYTSLRTHTCTHPSAHIHVHIPPHTLTNGFALH